MGNRHDDLEMEFRWGQLLNKIQKAIGKRPEDLDSVLYLIGIQELGQGVRTFTKEEKQDLMHIAVCRLLSRAGFYLLTGLDAEGWPQWELQKILPNITLSEQEKLLKMYALEYFEDERIFE